METKQATTAIVLDSRYTKKDGTHPIKLRIVFNRSSRMYAISIKLHDNSVIDSLTTDDLNKTKGRVPKDMPSKKTKEKSITNKPNEVSEKKPEVKPIFTFKQKDTYTEIKQLLAAKEMEAVGIIKNLEPFEFDKFRDAFTHKKGKLEEKLEGEPENIFWQYKRTVDELQNNNQLGTASNYDLSCKSLKRFIKFKNQTDKEPTKLLFEDVTVDFLTKYEDFMYNEGKDEEKGKGGKSPTTVSMYLRALRTIFNTAIEELTIESNLYPFRRSEKDKKKYEIPIGSKVNKALSKDDLKKLFDAKAKTPEQINARDFWFFSYTCNGMNMKDICLLRNENIRDDSLNYFRAKTKRTKKNQKELSIILTDFAQSIIEKYRKPDTNPKAFVFPILNLADSELIKRKKIQAFTRRTNQHVKLLATSVGISDDISTYYARHTFTTRAIQDGASIEYVSEALGHSDIKTTQGYIDSFPDKTKKDLMEGLMKF